MPANARQARRQTLLASDLQPPRSGLQADPVLYGVAAGLASLFPPVAANVQAPSRIREPVTIEGVRDRIDTK
ncbi:hypothetical protein JOE48_002232 [Methylobacterium sp. PvR107]|nr:hypothetical protein [Methylobacterium sp. PvR107]